MRNKVPRPREGQVGALGAPPTRVARVTEARVDVGTHLPRRIVVIIDLLLFWTVLLENI